MKLMPQTLNIKEVTVIAGLQYVIRETSVRDINFDIMFNLILSDTKRINIDCMWRNTNL